LFDDAQISFYEMLLTLRRELEESEELFCLSVIIIPSYLIDVFESVPIVPAYAFDKTVAE